MNDLAMMMLGLSGGNGDGGASENTIVAEYFNIPIKKEDTSLGADTWYAVQRLQFSDPDHAWAFYFIKDGLIRVKIATPTKDNENRLKVASCDAYFKGFLPCVYRVSDKKHIGVLEFSYGDIYLITDETFTDNVNIYIWTSGAISGSRDY